jgi:flagellar basal-body rod modification protein FlgD
MNITEAAAAGVSAQQDVFMKLFMAQLQNQDPEEPMSNAEMVSQLAQLTTLDVMNGLGASFQEVLKLQMLMSGTELLGRQVEYEQDGALQSGQVESVVNDASGVKLTVGGNEVSLDSVKRII